MKKSSLQFQLLLGIAISLIAVSVLTTGYSVYTTQEYLHKSARQDSIDRYQGMLQVLDIYKVNAQAHAQALARNPQIIDAARRRDAQALFAVTTPLMQDGKLDYMVITDPRGFAIIRTHEPGKIPKPDDSIANQVNIREAISGKSFVGIEEGKVVKLSVRAGAPLYDEKGVLVGAISTGYVISQNSIVDGAKKMFSAEFSLFLQDQRVATTLMDASGKRFTESPLNNPAIKQTVLTEGKTFVGLSMVEGREYAVAYGPLIGANGKTIGLIFTGTPVSLIERIINELTFRNVGVSVGVLLLVMLVAIILTRRLLKPLQLILGKIQEVSSGKLNAAMLNLNSKDEIGQLAAAINSMIANLRRLIGQVSSSAEQVARSAEELSASAGQSAEAATQVATTIVEVANGTEKQVAAVQDASSIVDRLFSGIEQIAANTGVMTQTAANAAQASKAGGQMATQAIQQIMNIEQTVTSSAQVVEKLGERSKEIGQIIVTISGIAAQTNLLALNAAIEAARAGEQGRGFAVVAEEVRKLAEQSEEAAQQIAKLIGEIQADTDKAVLAMGSGTNEVKTGTAVVTAAGRSFTDISVLVDEVSKQVTAISTAIKAMTSDSKQIVTSVREIDQVGKSNVGHTQTVSAATEEQSASMQEIVDASHALAKMADEMQRVVAGFKV
jgi:methyl-accepting chemotaxis protein